MEATKRPTDELIHWGLARVLWLGDGTYQLELSAAIEADTVNWLNAKLADRLGAVVGPNVGVEACPAVPTPGGYAQFGSIAIGGLSLPFPDAERLWEVISEAVAEGEEEGAKARQEARLYRTKLRSLA